MLMIKRYLKKVLNRISYFIFWKSKMTAENAREILQNYSLRPEGVCIANNASNIRYDLHIIIPVYNAEKYIAQCLNSVLLQQSDYKVIITVVNDGSTDETGAILEDISRCNSNSQIAVEVINQTNKGYSGARNTALKYIQGKYVTFLDADDILEDGAINNLLDAAYKWDADILQGSWYTFDSNVLDYFIMPLEGFLKDNRRIFSGFPWGKLYKYTVLEQFNFPEGFWFEDTPLSFILAAMPYRCFAIKNIVYGYRKNPEGITAIAGYKRKAIDSYWITEECLKEFPLFKLSYDQRAYEYFLCQCIMNERRLSKAPIKIREAQFILERGLKEKYFSGFRTEDKEMVIIEKTLQNKQFLKFILQIRSM